MIKKYRYPLVIVSSYLYRIDMASFLNTAQGDSPVSSQSIPVRNAIGDSLGELNPEVPLKAQETASRLRSIFAEHVIGQALLRESMITTLIAGGHILIESVPGLAKTTAARTLAQSVSGTFKRIQCTPDLMPADIIGTQIFNFQTQQLVTQIGPINANFVVLDEINRSSAKTQSAMLEAMAEGSVTIGGEQFILPRPFMVIATQNPVEEEGTYPLPEAQMDRFQMKVLMTYPSNVEEADMLRFLIATGEDSGASVPPQQRLDLDLIQFLRASARKVHVSDQIIDYAVNIAATSRGAGPRPISGLSDLVRLGASPRASIALIRVGQAFALINGRDFTIPEDIKMFAHEVLRHRMLLTFEAMTDGVTTDNIIDRILQAVPTP